MDPIDALMVQIGANDVGFGDVVRNCGHPLRNPCWSYREGGSTLDFHYVIQDNIRALSDHYRTLSDAINQQPAKVVMGEYPDPTQNGRGGYCGMNFDDAVGLIENGNWKGDFFGWKDGNISAQESRWAWGQVVLPLNNAVARAASVHRWDLVRMGDTSALHGYCSADRWTTTWEETWNGQGDEMGLLHPNRKGHQQYAAGFVEKLTPIMQETMRFPRTSSPYDKIDRGSCHGAKPPGDMPKPPSTCGEEQLTACQQAEQACVDSCAAAADPEACECRCGNQQISCLSKSGCPGGNARLRNCGGDRPPRPELPELEPM